MLFDNCATNTKQGDIGEARAIYEYTKLGYIVTRTLFDSARYDLIIDDGESLKRVQVKTTKHNYANIKETWSGYEVMLKTTGGNRKVNTIRYNNSKDYDLLFVLTDDNRCWSIPAEELKDAKNCIKVGTTRGNKYSKYELT